MTSLSNNSSLKVYSTSQYVRYLQQMVSRDFPEFEITREEELEYTEDIARIRFHPRKILIPGGNYGAVSLFETHRQGKERTIVGDTKVPALFVSRVEDFPRGLAMLARFKDENEAKSFFEANDPKEVISCYLLAETRRFR